MAVKRRTVWILGATGVVLAGLVTGVAAFMWYLSSPDRATGFIRNQIALRTEREVSLSAGWVDWGWKPVLRLRAVALEGKADAGILDLRLDPFGFLIGQRMVEHADIEAAAYSATLGSGGTGAPGLLDQVASVEMRQVRLDIARPNRPVSRLFITRGSGDLRSGDFEAEGRGGGADLTLSGRAAGLSLDGFEGEMTVSGDNFADFAALFGLSAPDTPPFTLSGGLSHDGDVWRFAPFDGTVGDSDLSGEMAADFSGDRPLLTADLRSDLLDLDDLGVIIGAPSDVQTGEENAQQAAINAAYAASPRLIPDAELDFTRFRAADAEVQFEAGEVKAGPFPLRSISFDLVLRDAVMTIDPLVFEAPLGGELDGRIDIDARSDTVRSRAEGRLEGFDLREIAQGRLARGPMTSEFLLNMTGSDLRSAFASADGEISFWTGAGAELRSLAVEGAGLDLGEVFLLILTEENENAEYVPVRCGAARFEVEDGIAHARPVVLDTEDSLITMTGEVSLETEIITLDVDADAKDVSWGSLLGGVSIGGTLRDPSVDVNAVGAVLQGGAAALLSGVAGPLAALPFTQPGLGEDAPCGAVLAHAQAVADREAQDG